jgi:hypothetical protein
MVKPIILWNYSDGTFVFKTRKDIPFARFIIGYGCSGLPRKKKDIT